MPVSIGIVDKKMLNHIEAILFDMGGTLRRTSKHSIEEMQKRIPPIMAILGETGNSSEFMQVLNERFDAYQRWSDETLVEAHEVELWTRWMLPDWPREQVSKNAFLLNRFWRDALAERTLLPETKDVIVQLFRSGYRLGLVSNTISSEEAPAALASLSIAGCFEVIVLSCVVGIKKPNPDILLLATRRMGIDSAKCAYVGDNPMRDVVSAKKAGFGRTAIIHSPYKPERTFDDPAIIPDYQIKNLLELTDIFPPLETNHHLPVCKKISSSQVNGSPVYNASLSTMWGIKMFPRLDDFFIAAGRMGFSQIELNHAVNSNMLAGIDLKEYRFSSIHEPCPADISPDMLKKNDWMISSIEEACRRQGVESIKRSIDLANELGVKVIVTHSGHVELDGSREARLRKLFQAGKVDSPEYDEIKAGMEEFRKQNIEAHLEAVIKSLRELLDYAGRNGIRLGLENRFHYFDIPSQDEMDILLGLADTECLGFIFDSGHARAMSLLGFFDEEMWLERYSRRIIGTHLQDAKGVNDHYAPGLGDIDFSMIAKYLPKEAFRIIEVQSVNSTEQVKNSLQYLADMKCVDPI